MYTNTQNQVMGNKVREKNNLWSMIPANTIKIFIPKVSLSSASMILTEKKTKVKVWSRISQKKNFDKQIMLIFLIFAFAYAYSFL